MEKAINMEKQKPAFTEEHIKLVAEKAAEKLFEKKEQLRNDPHGMGCLSHLGSIALKKHEAYHKNKLNSDIHNLRIFKESQETENKTLETKLTKVIHMFYDNAKDLSQSVSKLTDILNHFNKLEEKVDFNKKEAVIDNEKTKKNVWLILRWAVGIMITLGCTAYFSVNRSANDAKSLAVKAENMVKNIKSNIENRYGDEMIKEHNKFLDNIKKRSD